jgi:creatinine amidohydrolase/Fe(II)-dependent formamide hydrolase-like protein
VKYRYDEMTWPEVRVAIRHDPVLVLPTGTTEQHGYHLPLMVDYLCATEVARAAVERVAPWSLMTSADYRRWRESRFPGGTGHACELETSVVLHLRPDLVDMAKAVDEVSMQMSESLYWDLEGGGPVRFQEFFTRNSLSGVVGEATRATAEKGRLIFDVVVERLAGFLEKFRRREIRPRRELHDAERYPVP